MPSFPNKQTNLDLNGPILSFSKQPYIVSSILKGTFNISPATPGGLTTINLILGVDFSDFAAGVVYTLTPLNNCSVAVSLDGASGGGNMGGKGGSSYGVVNFYVGKTYKLVVGLKGSSNGISGAGGGGTAYQGGNSGGGYTGIFVDSISQNNAILIAGGGGGSTENDTRFGGDGGGYTALSAEGWTNNGGSQTVGGLGYNSNLPGYESMNGKALRGGDCNLRYDNVNGAGAGGGGYFGGGAGIEDVDTSPGPYGGGGGSGYINTNLVSEGRFNTATNTIGGKVKLSLKQFIDSTISISEVVLTGVATAFFPTQTPSNIVENGGYISYKWNEVGVGELNDGSDVVGSATTILTVKNFSGSNNSQRQFYLVADYIPSAYSQPSGSNVTAGTARSTANAINDPLSSEIVKITPAPVLSITSNPGISTVSQDSVAIFKVNAEVSDFTKENISYQWQINEVDLVDGITKDFPLTSVSPYSLLTITEDSTSFSTTIDFSRQPTYNNFVPNKVYTLVANKNIIAKITASGAGGGSSYSYRVVSGGSGGLSSGFFTFVKGKEYKLIVGGAGGSTAATPGYGGGGSNNGGGGGGGYTGLFSSSILQTNAVIIAGGGGGGGNDPASGGNGGGLVGTDGGNAPGRGGGGGSQSSAGVGGAGGGSSLQGGSGAGGGGGGYFGGAGGNVYAGCCADGAGGGGSGFIHPFLISNGSTVAGAGSIPGTNGSFKIEYVSSDSPISAVLEVNGSKTSTLSISSSIISGYSIRCRVSHPKAYNSPLYSTTTNFNVISPLNRAVVEVESYQPDSTTAVLREFDLTNLSYTIDSSVIDSDTICFYAKDRDLVVEMDMYGSKGTNYGNYVGGDGGYSKIRFTMRRNEEFILKGIKSKTALYLYRKAQLIACVGQGGDAGIDGNGGRGGGVTVSGENGFGKLSGLGGIAISSGQLSGNGVFGSSSQTSLIYSEDSKAADTFGGRTISCTKGIYWKQQGKTACQDLGSVKFRLSNGNEVSNSAIIARGFKDGYSVNQTAGLNSRSSIGRGGNGATGGQSGVSGGGGGGSGYTDSSVTVLNTTLGGNTENQTRVIMKLYEIIQDFYTDSLGRILIFSAATPGKDPRTLTKVTGRVLPGTDTCIDDVRWQRFLELAKTQDYRITATLDSKTTPVTKATPFNINRMINSNYIKLKSSLTDWQYVPYSYPFYCLAWDEDSIGPGFGSDYSILSWGGTAYYYGYYGQSSNSFFSRTTYSNTTANFWILPPGVPDFS